ncbi:SMP-30/gluconolactonase/LRE family protein [Mesorhizobium sp. LHD-90]|uniref:SMP-30/gluconolactonase/LRE family protein n=1 Tax=Mesorhizobium sp. LHD-90 TaxID=3071414 RepID=UPI0027DEC75B|nr:SMP-30/gluconolactonase/LRE family protein [Mesorhizobium sp. LHD-90]MDQ6435294.1 SMP-30/gluconolactonase/LRE family protein [Mesorhizobium sp. LHD-90]
MNVHAAGYHIECAVPSHDRLGETPLWCDRTRKLWWIDIEEPKLQSFDPATGAHERTPLPGIFAGTQALTKAGDRLLAEDLTLYARDADTGYRCDLLSLERGSDNRLNDGRVDAQGRFWVGTMDNGLSLPNGSLYRVDPEGTATRMETDIVVSNGIAFAPDGRTLYFTDTRRYTSYAYDLDPDDGAISNRRIFADYSATGDRPDGACVDVDGCIWAAFFAGGRIVRYRPDGRVDRTIAVPVSNPTCLCFGGPGLKTLYVTTARKFLSESQLAAQPLAGALLAIDGVGQGLPEHRFG